MNKEQSKAYDSCHDCGGDMTTTKNKDDLKKSILTVMYGDEIKEVYVRCNKCGGRAGHREYNAKNHI